MVARLTGKALEGWVGKEISAICGNAFANRAHNHCAHFVGHVLELKHGLKCSQMTHKPPSPGASIRCNELYNALPLRGPWDKAPTTKDGLLIFATSKSNVVANKMANHPRKHVGIVWNGAVFNYGNGEDKVRMEPTVEAFRKRMADAYKDPKIGLYYAVPQ